MNRKAILTLVLALTLIGPGGVPAGDSTGGTEGAAGPDLGQIDFPTSGPPTVQDHFLRGVLWLHSFEYADARTEFRRARELAPDFAMAAWGEAMSENHPIWTSVDLAAGRAALDRLAPDPAARRAKAPTDRERGYLAAVEALYGEGDKPARDRAYAEAMRRLRERFPDDDEAAAFYALALLGTCQGERDFPTYMRAAAVAEEVFARNRRHPGALHYLIHAYDEPVHGPLGLRPARLYAEVAPAAPHALHMPSHIFLALGMWDQEVASNEASWRAARDRGSDNYHALWWLAYGYLQQGRYADARGTLDTLAASGGAGGASGRRHLAYMRAAHLVESRRWAAEFPAVDPAGLDLAPAAVALFTDGYRAIGVGDADGARAALAAIRSRRADAAEAGDGDAHVASLVEAELAALLAFASGDGETAVGTLRTAVVEDEARSLEYGPPVPPKPPGELLGEILLGLGRPAEARQELERVLARFPGRSRALLAYAHAAAAAGDGETAGEAYARLARQWHRADPDLPELAEVRRGAGAREAP